MTDDNIANLMLEQFRLLGAQIEQISAEVQALKADMLSVHHASRSHDPFENRVLDLAALKIRVERIERHLGLTEK